MTRLFCLLLLAGCGRSEDAPPDLLPGALPDAAVDECPAGLNSCGECAPPPIEECNGRDDDCNGIVDDDCSFLWPHLQPINPPVRLYAGSVVAVQTDAYTPYGSESSYRYALLYTASVGAAPEVLAGTPITDAGVQNESERDPDFDGTWLVWRRTTYYDYNSPSSLVAMTLADRQPLEIPAVGLGTLGPPSVSNGRVAFAAVPTGQSDADIFLYDLAKGTRSDLTFAGVLEAAPALSGDWVAYERRDTASGDAQVRAVHIPDGVLDGPSEGLEGSHTAPAIDGTQVVWTRSLPPPSGASPYAPAPSEVWWYDLATRARRKLGDGQRAQIRAGLACWDGPDGVWAADTRSAQTARVATAGSFCAIDGRRVAWIGHQGLTYRDLPENQP